MIDALHQVPGLEELGAISDQYRVDIIARGRMVRLLYMASLLQPERAIPDVFDTTPFTTAIDLIHTGPTDLNGPLYEAIHRRVPFAECFRWRIGSLADDRGARRRANSEPSLPVNSVTLSTKGGFSDPFNAHLDFGERRYRFAFSQATTSPTNRDVGRRPLFEAIQYLEALFDAKIDDDMERQPGFDTARAVIKSFEQDGGVELVLGNERLRVQLHVHLERLGAAVCSDNARDVIDVSGLSGLLKHLDEALKASRIEEESPFLSLSEVRQRPRETPSSRSFSADLRVGEGVAIASSQYLGGDRYRLPSSVRFVTRVDYDDPLIGSAIGWNREGASALAPDIKVRQMSSWIRIAAGRPQGGRPFFLGPNEMVSFAILDTDSATSDPADDDLSMLILVHQGDSDAPIGVAMPFTTCVSSQYDRNGRKARLRTFRAACGSLFDTLSRTSPVHLAFAVAQRDRVDEPPESARLSNRGGKTGGGSLLRSLIDKLPAEWGVTKPAPA